MVRKKWEVEWNSTMIINLTSEFADMKMKKVRAVPPAGEKVNLKDEVWKYKKYVCRAKLLDLTAGGKIVVLNEAEAHENDLYASHRVIQVVGQVDDCDLVQRGEIMLFSEVLSEFDAKEGDRIEILHMQRPDSIEFIKKKMEGKELTEPEMNTIMQELMQNRLSEAELASFITSMYIRGMTPDEVVGLTNSVVASGTSSALKSMRANYCNA